MKKNTPSERLINGIIKENPTFVLMLGNFSIFFCIILSVFWHMLPDAVSRFSQIIAQIRIPDICNQWYRNGTYHNGDSGSIQPDDLPAP